MTRHYNTLHPDRHGRGTYHKRKKYVDADRYGYYESGVQKAPDKIAGKASKQRAITLPSRD